MGSTLRGSVRLFRVAGIDVFVHWTWLIAAWVEMSNPPNRYQNQIWNAIEYFAIFRIVTLHEFGHVLACRGVGGAANQITLWPLGGHASVQPPARPGALLWTIGAGPLVNFVLVPVTIGLCFAADSVGLRNDPARFLVNLTWINGFLLLFNILPIYPLDGGQMLQAVLWFVVGRAWSLLIVGCLGLAIGLGIVGVSVWADQWLLALIAVAFVVRSVSAFQFGRNIGRMADVPRREKFACPSCRLPPPVGEFWTCNKCKTPFDIFENPAICPACESQSTCGTEFAAAQCVMCQAQHPLLDWLLARAVDAPLIEKAIDRANPYASFGDVADRVAT